MGDIYVRSTTGSNANSGASWAAAKLDLAGADAIDVAGDRILCSQVHAETTAASVALAVAGTLASPTQVLCVSDAASPPTSLATTGTVTTTGNSNLSINGNLYCYGLTFSCGTTAVSPGLSLGSTGAPVAQRYEKSAFRLGASGAGSRIAIGALSSTVRAVIRWIACTVQFAATGQGITLPGGSLHWIGGSITGATIPTALFRATSSGTDMRSGGALTLDGVDLSALGANAVCEAGFLMPRARVLLRNCKLAASTVLVTGTIANPEARLVALACDNGDKTYRIAVRDYAGTIDEDTSVYLNGGATDYTPAGLAQPYSIKMVSNANANKLVAPLFSEDFGDVQLAVGSSKTFTVEIAGPAGLKDDEVWLETNICETSADVSTTFRETEPNVLATAANLTTSALPWTGSPAATYKLSVTVTPRVAGVYRVRVALAKASTTVYVNEQVAVT